MAAAADVGNVAGDVEGLGVGFAFDAVDGVAGERIAAGLQVLLQASLRVLEGRRLGQPRDAARAAIGMAEALRNLGEFANARRVTQEALEVLHPAQDSDTVAALSQLATLATFAAYRGIANVISDGRAQGYTGIDPVFVFLARGNLAGVPVLIWILLVVAVTIQFMLHYTDFGRNIYAIGGNAIAARLAGIAINRYILGCYVLIGAVAALAGVLLTARTGSGQPTSALRFMNLIRGWSRSAAG